nr:helicase [Marseillevirus cajuinensis]
MGDEGVIYLVRNDALWRDNIFKVGKSSNFKTRLSSYGKIRVLDTFSTKFITMCERDVLEDFSTKFPKAFGQEYFLCSEEDAINTFTKAKERILSSVDEMERNFLASHLCQYEDEQTTKSSSQDMLPKDNKISERIWSEFKRVGMLIDGEFSCCNEENIHDYFGVSQKEVTPEFLEKYKDKKHNYTSLCLTFGEEREVSVFLESFETKNEHVKRTKFLRECLLILGFAEWHRPLSLYKDRFGPAIKNVRKKIMEQQSQNKELFSNSPKDEKDTFRWLNVQLRKVFGFWFAKKKGNKGDYRCHLVFGALWDYGQNPEYSGCVVPKIRSLCGDKVSF